MLQQLEERPGSDLAHLVHHQHAVAGQGDAAVLHPAQERVERQGALDAGVLQRVGLTPGGGDAHNLPAALVRPGVGMPCRDQRLEQRGLARAGDAGDEAEPAAAPQAVDRRLLGGAVLRLAVEVEPGGIDRRLDRGDGQRAGLVVRGSLGTRSEVRLDPDLGRVGDADLGTDLALLGHELLVGHLAHDQRHALAAQGDAALLQQLDHPVDVLRPGDAGQDHAPRCPGAELVVVDHRGCVELLGEVAGGELVCLVEPLDVGQRGRLGVLQDGRVLPADALSLVVPALLLGMAVTLGPALGHGSRAEDAELALGREVGPVEPLAPGERLGVLLGLLPALGEQVDRCLRDRRQSQRLLLSIILGADAHLAQAHGEAALEVGAELVDPVLQPLGVKRADPAALGGHHVEHAVVDVVVRIAGQRHLGQVGHARLAVLDLQRRPGSVVEEGHPAHLARIGTFLAVPALPGPADLTGHVAHGVVVGTADRLADPGGLGR